MRTERGQRPTAVFSPARRVRPPLVGALLVVLALIGVIVWLTTAEDRPDIEQGDTQLRLSLKDTTADETDDAPSTDASTPSPDASATHDGPESATGGVVATPAADGAVEVAVKAPDIISGPPLPNVDPVLLQPSSRGPLPIIGPDGRRPWQVYAKPYEGGEGTPRLAIVVAELGFSRDTTEAAMKLPAEVTLSFSPYAPNLAEQVAAARQAGHEVMIDLPMEPISYPADDPGPETLLVGSSAVENVERLETVLGRAQGYVGVISHMGSKFTTSPDVLRPVLGVLAERGLLFVDAKTSVTSVAGTLAEQLRLPRALNDRFIDNEATRLAIDEGLAAVESDARREGVALGVGRPFPVTLQRLAAWLPTLKTRGIALAPVSAVVDRQKAR